MKVRILALALLAISMSACHFRHDEALESVERNKKYKSEGIKADRENATSLPEDAAAKMTGGQTAVAADTVAVDTTQTDAGKN